MQSSPDSRSGASPDQPPITCPQCSLPLPDSAHFCPRCGFRFARQESRLTHASQSDTSVPPRSPNTPIEPPVSIASPIPPAQTYVAVPPPPPVPYYVQPVVPRPLVEAMQPPVYPLQPPMQKPIAPPEVQSMHSYRASSSGYATTAPDFIEKGIELWWVRVPVFLRRYSLLLSEICSDGIYLTVRPIVALWLPLFAFLFGLLEGFTHWTLMIGADPAITFTEMLPFLCVVGCLGALSTNLGFLLVLGYALGDFLIGQHLSQVAGLYYSDTPFSLLLFYLTLLVSYGLLFILAVIPTFIGRYMALGIVVYVKGRESFLIFLRIIVETLVMAGVVYAYTQAGPLMIRVLWGWIDQSPPVSAAYYLQVLGHLIAIAAIIGSLARGLGIYLASRSKKVMLRSRRLLVGLLRADKKTAFTRRVPLLMQVTLLAVVMSLFVSGIVGNLILGAIFFLFVWGLLFLRMVWLPRIAFWQTWARLLASIPLLLRVLLGAFLTYNICGWLIEQLFSAPVLVNNSSGSFQWLLISSCIGLVIMTTLTPQPPASMQRRGPVQSTLTSPPTISPQAPPLMGPSR